MVLILVVVDNGLVLCTNYLHTKIYLDVLILVVVDDGLVRTRHACTPNHFLAS